MEQDDSIPRKVVARIKDITVGLPLVHLTQPPLGDPHEGIDPQQAPHRLGKEVLDRMAVADMARLMAEHHLAPFAFIARAHVDRVQE